jgi:hypothetical protein
MSDLTFAPTKLHHLIAYLVNALDAKIGRIELVKLVYLIDVEYYRLFGETLTGLDYIRHEKGPYTKSISEAADEMDGYELTVSIEPSSGFSQYLKHSHGKGNIYRFEVQLEPAELWLVEQVLQRVKDLSPRQLEGEAYKTEPMQAIIQREKDTGEQLICAPLDFGLIKRNAFMVEWLKNKAALSGQTDPEYEEFLRQERAELESLLQ